MRRIFLSKSDSQSAKQSCLLQGPQERCSGKEFVSFKQKAVEKVATHVAWRHIVNNRGMNANAKNYQKHLKKELLC